MEATEAWKNNVRFYLKAYSLTVELRSQVEAILLQIETGSSQQKIMRRMRQVESLLADALIGTDEAIERELFISSFLQPQGLQCNCIYDDEFPEQCWFCRES